MNPACRSVLLTLLAGPLPLLAADPSLLRATAPSSGLLLLGPAGTSTEQWQTAPAMVAGHPNPAAAGFPGITPDSPAARVDPNTTSSLFSGVGSIFIDPDPGIPGGFICTGTPISPWHVLTAAHCLDTSGSDGVIDPTPPNVEFILNYGSNSSHTIPAMNLQIHPDFTGYANPSINDDLALITLSQQLPAGVPIYKLANPSWLGVAPVLMAGYGTSGDGVNGYTISPSFEVKRTGANLIEYSESDDEGSGQVELIAWDFEFEGEPNRYDYFGIPFSFPNDEETTVGGGDSGGPSFMLNPGDPLDNGLYLAVVNTFSWWDVSAGPDHDEAGKFGAGGGGMWLGAEYQAWVTGAMTDVPEPSTWFGGGSLAALAALSVRRLRGRA